MSVIWLNVVSLLQQNCQVDEAKEKCCVKQVCSVILFEVGGLLSTSPPSTNLLKKSMGVLLRGRKETENHLNWLQGVKAARLPAERSRKRGGKKERPRANWKVKKEVNVRENRCNI